MGSESVCAEVWGVDVAAYIDKADPWPLSKEGELLLGLKIESAEALPYIEEILAVRGIGFAEMGPGDLGMSLRSKKLPRPWKELMQETHERVKAACGQNGVAFLEGVSPETIAEKIDGGVRVIAGGNEETARVGRAHSGRRMPS